MWKYLQTVFSLNTKALSVFRILLALIVLCDLWFRIWSFDIFLSVWWVMPLELLFDNHYNEAFWSLHTLIAADWRVISLLIIEWLAVIWLLVWRKTRVMSIVVWVLICGVQARNPMILNWWDTVLRVLLFWSLFLPLWVRRSVDSRTVPKEQRPTHICHAWSVWFILQMVSIYVFSYILKADPSRHSNFDATYLALSLDAFRTPLGDILYGQYDVMKVMTQFVYLLEWRWRVLLFFPRKNTVTRTGILWVFCMFHLGLALTMHIGTFPWIMIAWWITLLPLYEVSHWDPEKKIVDSSMRWTTTLLLSIVFIYITCWNIRTTDFDRHAQWFPYEMNRIGFLLRVEQHRSMFAPYPTLEDGRYEINWVAQSWPTILHKKDYGILYGSNPWIDRRYSNEKRHKLYNNMRSKSWSYLRDSYLSYLCSQENFDTIDMNYITEKTLANYQTAPSKRIFLATKQCTH